MRLCFDSFLITIVNVLDLTQPWHIIITYHNKYEHIVEDQNEVYSKQQWLNWQITVHYKYSNLGKLLSHKTYITKTTDTEKGPCINQPKKTISLLDRWVEINLLCWFIANHVVLNLSYSKILLPKCQKFSLNIDEYSSTFCGSFYSHSYFSYNNHIILWIYHV